MEIAGITIDATSLTLGVVLGSAVVGLASASGGGAPKKPTGKVTIYYWPMLGRAGSLFRMCEHAGVDYEHISEFPEIAKMGSAFGGQGNTFAPPIAVINGKAVSQSTAACLYVGKRCGLTEGMDEDKAAQCLIDLIDTFEGGLGGALSKGGAALKGFFEGNRWTVLAGNIDRSIKGPFYFGEKMTCVDFFLCNIVDWFCATLLDRLEKEKGATPLAPYKTILDVVKRIRALPSYGSTKYNLKVCEKPDGANFFAPDDVFKTYKDSS